MACVYQPSGAGALRQGEILGRVWIHSVVEPAAAIPDDRAPQVISLVHERMLVLHADCDLEWDHSERDGNGNERQDAKKNRLIAGVLVCDAFYESEVRPRVAGADIWRRVQQNQDERYHRLSEGPLGQTDEIVTSMYLDFKTAMTVAPAALYAALAAGLIPRIAVVPPIYLHDLIHRFFAFQSRVALPE